MNIMVTGAGGMVGSHMIELLHSKGESVIGTYYKPTTDIKELPKGIRMIECDVRYAPSVETIMMEYMPPAPVTIIFIVLQIGRAHV